MFQSHVRYERYFIPNGDPFNILPRGTRAVHALFGESNDPGSMILIPYLDLSLELEYLLRQVQIETNPFHLKDIYKYLKAETVLPSPLTCRIYTILGEDETGTIPHGTIEAQVKFSEKKPSQVNFIPADQNLEKVLVESDPEKVQKIYEMLMLVK